LLKRALRFILPVDAAFAMELTGPSPGTDDDSLHVHVSLTVAFGITET